jgi:hypothetical protein
MEANMRYFVDQDDRNYVSEKLRTSPIGALDPAAYVLAKAGFCPTCGGEANEFDDGLSLREYRISGMCQGCQDGIFDGESREVSTDPSDPAFD